jgi:hypothetical protein
MSTVAALRPTARAEVLSLSIYFSCMIRKPFGLQDPLPQTHGHCRQAFPLTWQHILAFLRPADSHTSYVLISKLYLAFLLNPT